MAAIRRPVRSRPIRLFLISMFAVPLVSLIGLWVFVASITVPRAISDHNYNIVSTARNGPAVTALTTQLPVERAQTYAWLLSGRTASNASLLATRKTVDQALPGAEVALQSKASLLSPAAKAALNTLLTDLRKLGRLRKSVDSGNLGPAAAFQAYSDIVDAQFQSYNAETLDRAARSRPRRSATSTRRTRLTWPAGRSRWSMARWRVSCGVMSADARELFTASVASRRQMLAMAILPAARLLPLRLRHCHRLADVPLFAGMEDQIDGEHGQRAGPGEHQGLGIGLGAVLSRSCRTSRPPTGCSSRRRASQAAAACSPRPSSRAALASSRVIVSIVLLAWFGRKVTRDLTRLNDSVRAMAEERLPRVVDRLRRGEDVDVLAESPPPGASGVREISTIAESFATVQKAAVAAAVDQAQLRKGVNQVFLNISMRNQSLLHRQLGMLDSMERQTSDPGVLADLFRLDHLTTRMRRHAEGLIILSGSTPGRGWRDPVPVVDVLRAAVAEVEDYVRVDVLSESRDLVAGNAVNDVIHLIAELVENATAFSPPNTRIEDQGRPGRHRPGRRGRGPRPWPWPV